MDILRLIGTATGLGLLAGIRLYATVLGLGLAVRFGLIELRPEFQQMEVLGEWWVIGLAGTAFVLEFFADKIPWVDSVWDAIHTVVRPLGAAVVTLAALGDLSPYLQITIAILTGGVAFTSHAVKATTRLAVNHSPEPVSNSLLSLAGDVAVPIGIWVAMKYPLLVGSLVAVFVTVFLIVSPRVFRLLHVQIAAMRALIRGAFRSRDPELGEPLPEGCTDVLARELGKRDLPEPVRAVAGRGVGRLKNSIGYLLLLEDQAVFITRRWFRYRVHRTELTPETARHHKKGLLLDRLTIRNGTETCYYGLIKDRRLEISPAAVAGGSTSLP